MKFATYEKFDNMEYVFINKIVYDKSKWYIQIVSVKISKIVAYLNISYCGAIFLSLENFSFSLFQ